MASLPITAEVDDYESLAPSASFLSHMLAGAVAGITEHSVTYPLDVIKTRMQAVEPVEQASTGMSKIFSQIRSEGDRKFFRGIATIFLGAGPAHALYFATYEFCKARLSSVGSNPASIKGHLASGLSGACATIAADAFMNPFDVIKQRMQIRNSQFRGVLDCAKSVYLAGGIASFYVSYSTTLILNVPFHAIQFPTYEAVRRTLNPSGKYNPLAHIASGAVAGGLAGALTTPLDCIRTFLQTTTPAATKSLSQVLGAVVYGAHELYKRRGIRGFCRGIIPRCLANMPATAICWTTYEYLKHLLS